MTYQSVVAQAWRLYRANFKDVAGLFAVVFTVLAPLHYLIAIELPAVALIPLALLVQVIVPVFAGSLALMVCTIMLNERDAGRTSSLADAWAALRPRLRAAFAGALAATLVAVAVALIPYWGVPLILSLLHLILGPPLVAHLVTLERLELNDALRRVGPLVSGRGGRVTAYLVGTALALGLLALVTLGPLGAFLLEAPYLVQVFGLHVLQGIVLGVLMGYLCCLELVIYTALSSAGEKPNR